MSSTIKPIFGMDPGARNGILFWLNLIRVKEIRWGLQSSDLSTLKNLF